MSIVRVPFSLTGGGAGGYVPAGAIWLDGSADYLSWTPSGAADDGTEWWLSVWIKDDGQFDGNGAKVILGAGPSGTNRYILDIDSTNYNLRSDLYESSQKILATSAAAYRDYSAWRHVAVHYDSDEATAADRYTVYDNGEEVTFSGSPTYPASAATSVVLSAVLHRIGLITYNTVKYWSGYMADFAMVDGGGSLTIADFGETDAFGNWVPKDLSGLTFGTNGFWLDFADSADLGNDVSGNGNDWTLNSMSSANATNDNPADDSANDIGNRWVTGFDSTYNYGGTLSNRNLTLTHSSDPSRCIVSNALIHAGMIPDAGWEFHVTSITGDNQHSVYLMQSDEDDFFGAGATAKAVSYDGPSGVVKRNGTTITTANTYGAGDTVEVWIGSDSSGTVKFYKNGSLEATVTSVFANDERYRIGVYMGWNASVHPTMTLGFYDLTPVNSGKEFNTAYLPAPAVTDPSAYFKTLLYTGNSTGSTAITGCQDASGTNWTPDLVWIKPRTFAADGRHCLYDQVRGANKRISSNNTNAEATDIDCLDSFDSGGFTLGADTANNLVNDSGYTYVAWCLNAGGSGSSNTDGTITSTVSAAAHGGFSIGTYTGTGSNATVGHGLDRTPSLYIVKDLDNSTDWFVYNETSGATKYLKLNTIGAETTSSIRWNDTAPTSSVFSLGTSADVNGSGADFVFYAFARTPGLIGIGSYTGNGSADGPYVVVDDGASGFRPAFFLVKVINTTQNWFIFDSARNTYNEVDLELYANLSAADSSRSPGLDFVANGVKLRTSYPGINASGDTFIYLAFAEYPFGGAGVEQARAR
jgi:hypothetical protein